MFLLAVGFIQMINAFPLGKWVMLGGFGVILYVLFGWFGKVISESQTRRLPRLGGPFVPLRA